MSAIPMGLGKEGAMDMQTQIRFSSLVLSVFMSIGVVVSIIALHPPLTPMYYVQLGALVAGAGLIVTLYNHFLTVRTRRRDTAAAPVEGDEVPTVETASARAAYADTQGMQPAVTAVAYPAAPVVQEAGAAEVLPKSLDALLDIAYEAAAEHPLRAIAAYRRALARYPNDSYMPYLIIELSTLYKQLGSYDAALALFDEALALPLIAKNAGLVQEFQRSRRVLAVVSDMLTAQGIPALPFGEVPKGLLAEAERQAAECKEERTKQTF